MSIPAPKWPAKFAKLPGPAVNADTALNDPNSTASSSPPRRARTPISRSPPPARARRSFAKSRSTSTSSAPITCLAVVKETGAIFQIGFNRRFDPSFRALKQRLLAGEIGNVEQVIITSRDPEPETEEQLRAGSGVFREMTIHDFDMARNLLGEEPTHLFATGSALVTPAYKAVGDYDTAMFVLRTASGRQCHINNSVRATYGYDQRIEVQGALGMLSADNRTPTSVKLSNAKNISTDKPLYFFTERFAKSYALELDHFVTCIEKKQTPEASARRRSQGDDTVRGRVGVGEERTFRAGANLNRDGASGSSRKKFQQVQDENWIVDRQSRRDADRRGSAARRAGRRPNGRIRVRQLVDGASPEARRDAAERTRAT